MAFREVTPTPIPSDSILYEDDRTESSGNTQNSSPSRLTIQLPNISVPSLSIPKVTVRFLPLLMIPVGLGLVWYGISSSVAYTASNPGLQHMFFQWDIINVVVMTGLLVVYDGIKRFFA